MGKSKLTTPSFIRASRALAAAALLFFAGTGQAQQPAADRLALCAACHGAQGVSATPTIPSLAGQPKLFLENQLVLIREGLRDIAPMKGLLDGLKDTELSALATYFAGLGAPAAATTGADPARVQRGRELAHAALCGTCHLGDYRGREQIPRLAGQQEVFLLETMKQLRDRPSPGRDPIMSASLYGLNDAQLADLAHFFAHYQP